MALPLTTWGEIGKAIYVKGNVSIQRIDGESTPLLKDQLINKGDEIITGENSLAILGIGEKLRSKVKIDENSSLVLDETNYEIPEIDLELKKGSALIRKAIKSYSYKGQKKTTPFSLFIKTKYAAMGVRGTEFFAYVGEGKKVSLDVNKGDVLVLAKGSDQGFSVKGGEGTLTNDQNKLIKPRAFDWRALINWNLDPHSGPLNQSKELFQKIADSWGKYSKETEHKWQQHEARNKSKFEQMQENNRKNLERLRKRFNRD